MHTMRLTEPGEDRETAGFPDLATAVSEYESRDARRVALWNNCFST